MQRYPYFPTRACRFVESVDTFCRNLSSSSSFSSPSAVTGCVKMFPPKTRADVGMVQCASEGHGKPTGEKTVGTRRRAGPCKEGGSLSMQNPGH